jgi:hypothetical protein
MLIAFLAAVWSLVGCSMITHEIYLRGESGVTEWTREASSLYDDYPSVRYDRPGLRIMLEEKWSLLHDEDGRTFHYLSIGPPFIPLFFFFGNTADPFKDSPLALTFEVSAREAAVSFDLGAISVRGRSIGEIKATGARVGRGDDPTEMHAWVVGERVRYTVYFTVRYRELQDLNESLTLTFPEFQVGDTCYTPKGLKFSYESKYHYSMLTMLSD